jgi:hypothetical protein
VDRAATTARPIVPVAPTIRIRIERPPSRNPTTDVADFIAM